MAEPWKCPFGQCDGVVRPYGSRSALRRHLSNVHDSDLVREHLRRGHYIDRVVKLEGDDLTRRKEAVKNQGRHFHPHQRATTAASLPVVQPPPAPPLSVLATIAYISVQPSQLPPGLCSEGPRPADYRSPDDTASDSLGDLSGGQDRSVLSESDFCDLTSSWWGGTQLPELTDPMLGSGLSPTSRCWGNSPGSWEQEADLALSLIHI